MHSMFVRAHTHAVASTHTHQRETSIHVFVQVEINDEKTFILLRGFPTLSALYKIRCFTVYKLTVSKC